MDYFCLKLLSSSSWGCELKYCTATKKDQALSHPPREDVSWNEKDADSTPWDDVILLVRMWVEISIPTRICQSGSSSSSWGCELKYVRERTVRQPWQSSSSWGCELKYAIPHILRKSDSHPPREDVSWNVTSIFASSNCVCHPPREDVSWNETQVETAGEIQRHPPREDVSWNLFHFYP